MIGLQRPGGRPEHGSQASVQNGEGRIQTVEDFQMDGCLIFTVQPDSDAAPDI